MGRAVTLLEDLCAHAIAAGVDSLEVERDEGYEWVYARQGDTGVSIAHFESSSADGRELLGNLYAAARKPVRIAIAGQVRILKVRIRKNFDEDAFDVRIEMAPKTNPAKPPKFTAKQGQYLAFIHYYSKVHRQAPAEMDLQKYFQVSPPSVHEMIKTLERNGLIERTPGEARSIRLLVGLEHLPALE